MQNFVRVLIQNDRLAVLPEIATLFESLKNEREGVVEAQIESAFPVDDAALAQLVGDLERRFKRKVRPQLHIDRALIGGALIKVGDEVIDGTVRGGSRAWPRRCALNKSHLPAGTSMQQLKPSEISELIRNQIRSSL